MLKIYHPTQQKFVYPNKTTMPVQVGGVKFSISCITILCKVILINIPLGNKRRKIHLVMTGEQVGDTWHTINKNFDTLYAKIWQTCGNITMGHICLQFIGIFKICYMKWYTGILIALFSIYMAMDLHGSHSHLDMLH